MRFGEIYDRKIAIIARQTLDIFESVQVKILYFQKPQQH